MGSAVPQRSFFSELKRRHVFRVAAVYAAAAWGVLEGTGTLVQLLELPAWTGKLVVLLVVLGLPLALILAWAYDLTPAGVERTSGDPGVPAKPRGSRLLVLSGAVVLVLALAGAVLLRYRTVRASPTVVAVLPFSARGNADYLGEGMADLLSRNLDGVEHLRSVDPATVVRLSRRESHAEALDVDGGRDLASKLGAGLFVLGHVSQAAGVLRITAALYDLDRTPQEPQVRASVQGDSARLFQLVDSLTAQLLAGLKHGAASEHLVHTAAATTGSLAALKAYLDGERHLRATEYDSASLAFEEAVELDSTFALAGYRLAITARLNADLAWGSHSMSLAAAALQRALRFAARLPERDRRLLQAYAAFDAGDVEQAEELYRALRRDYADDPESTFELAELLYRYNPARARPSAEAIPLYQQVMRADPGFGCPI